MQEHHCHILITLLKVFSNHPAGLHVKHLATCTEAPMHGHGPGQRARLTPSKKVGLVLEKGGGRGVYLAA